MKKHLRLNNFFLIALLAAVAAGCGKDKPKTGYVARVNEQYLSAAELDVITDSSTAGSAAREEALKRWIDREVLYQYARKQGFFDDPEFQALKKDQEKQLAAAWIVRRDDFIKVELPESAVREYYEKHNQEFRLAEDAYLFDQAVFSGEEPAVEFKRYLAETDWSRAVAFAAKRNYGFSVVHGDLLRASAIYSGTVVRLLAQLNSGETGPVVRTEDGKFNVITLVTKYAAGEVPPFDLVKNQVATLLKEAERKRLLEEKLKELYSDNDIEIR